MASIRLYKTSLKSHKAAHPCRNDGARNQRESDAGEIRCHGAIRHRRIHVLGSCGDAGHVGGGGHSHAGLQQLAPAEKGGQCL